MTCAISSTLRSKPSRLPAKLVEKLAKHILGTSYDVSVVFCGDRLSERLNKTYRNKGRTANVLSFPLSKNEGEIFINLRKANREAVSLSVSPAYRARHLLIHGMLHLKGLSHGSTMDSEEARILKLS